MAVAKRPFGPTRAICGGFVPAEGMRFVSAGADSHRQTTALIFGVAPDAVTREMRDRAKTVNFAVIYGIGPFALGQKLGIGTAEAKEFIDEYFRRFPGVRRYLDEQMDKARTTGYVETLTGRWRYIPEINARNFNVRSFGERAATNAPIQGSSADLIKIAMIAIQKELEARKSPAKMLVQVHDELLFEVPAGQEEEYLELVRDRMENAAELSVPLKVESGIGDNWLETK